MPAVGDGSQLEVKIMINESVNYLRESDEVLKTVIIGGLLLLFSFLIIPLFVLWGYVVRVLDRTMHENDDAPVFDEWGELLVDGVKAAVVMIGYGLVPLVVGTILVGGVLLTSGGDVGSVGAAGLALAGLVTFALAIAAAYAIPAALANYTTERTIGAGFDLDTLRPVWTSGTYATRWLLSVVVLLAGSIIAGLLNVIPFVGMVLGAMVSFYALIAAYYIIGHTWSELRPVGAAAHELVGEPAV